MLLDANGDDGVVLGAIFSDADTVPVVSRDKWHRRFVDGTTIEYDRESHKLRVDCVGDIELVSATHIRLQAPRIDLN